MKLEKPKDKAKKKVTFTILKGYVKLHECKLEVQNNILFSHSIFCSCY